MLFVIILSLTVLSPRPAEAISKDVRTVFVTSFYGLLAGTGLGLIALPSAGGGIRTVFIGSSIGLYLGIAIGIYHNQSRNDPQNPLSYGQHSFSVENPYGLRDDLRVISPRPIIALHYPVLKF